MAAYYLYPVLTTILFWLFILSIAIQLWYALFFFTRLFSAQHTTPSGEYAQHPVSIVICAKNEAANLKRNLPAILAQRYTNEAGKPMYEVIVVNDASEDDTEEVLYYLEQEYSQLWHVTIAQDEERIFQGKKFALGRGVSAASWPWLLLTDADCEPTSEEWLRRMVAPLEHGKEIVAGYGGYRQYPGLLNAFIRWETIHTFLQYSTYIFAGKPYMAVGRNLACTKEVFTRAQQSEVWNKLPSGDDDLLMRCCATRHNTAVVWHRDAFTVSEPKRSWRSWLMQKQRHVSTGKYYRDDIQLLLGIYAGAHAFSWLLFFTLLFCSSWKLVLFLQAMRCAVYWTIWQSTAYRLQDRILLSWMPLCDLGWMIYNFALSPYIVWKNKRQWK